MTNVYTFNMVRLEGLDEMDKRELLLDEIEKFIGSLDGLVKLTTDELVCIMQVVNIARLA